ncbi:MAG: hypothetical protein M1815_003332 [Lichina confinis]|nr:MAG: hypothetical protein M1815_003332 [Lichina confinis]
MALFEALPRRPPTPPRLTGLEQSIVGTKDNAPLGSNAICVHRELPDNLTATPPTPSTTPVRSRKRKRVEWSPWTEYVKAPSPASLSLGSENATLKPLTPSRDRKSSTSILKQPEPFGSGSSPASSVQEAPGESIEGLDLLELHAHTLVMGQTQACLEAYVGLNRALIRKKNLPESVVFQGRMSQILQFIQRDILPRHIASSVRDINLRVQALKLLVTIASSPTLSTRLSNDLCRYMLNQAIELLEDKEQPKAVTNCYMQLLSLSKFGSDTLMMTMSNRIVAALAKVTDHVMGTAILCQRLVIYQRLASVAPETMALRAGDWVDQLFAGLGSGRPDLRSQTIAFGLEAALALGGDHRVSRAVVKALQRPVAGTTMALHLVRYLGNLASQRGDGVDASKIWTVVVLFFRRRSRQLERWEHLKDWLLLIERCFNSSDEAVKLAANLAWVRMIYVVNPSDQTGPLMLKVLRQPILGHIKKTSSGQNCMPVVRESTLACLCSLLYYSLRPSASWQQLDTYWEQYVVPIVLDALILKRRGIKYGSLILTSLLGVHPPPWERDRALEERPFTVEEISPLNPKWVRSRTRRLLDTCHRIFTPAEWLGEPSLASAARKLWSSLNASISEARSKEIKLSGEHTDAVAQMLAFFQTIWIEAESAVHGEGSGSAEELADLLDFMVHTMLVSFDAPLFRDRFILQGSGSALQTIVTTPSRSVSESTPPAALSPMTFLFQLLGRASDAVASTRGFERLANTIITMCCRSRSGLKSQIESIQECSGAMSTSTPGDDWTIANGILWQLLAQATVYSLNFSLGVEASETFASLDLAQKHLVNVLMSGCNDTQEEHRRTWEALLRSGVAYLRSKSEGSDGNDLVAHFAGIIAKRLRGRSDAYIPSGLSLVIMLVNVLDCESDKPRSSGSRCGGGHRAASTSILRESPFYQLVNDVLQVSYRALATYDGNLIKEFLNAVSKLIERCHLSVLGSVLSDIQVGLGLWLEDRDGQLLPREGVPCSTYSNLLWLWSTMAPIVVHLLCIDTELVRDLDTLVSSALQSRHCEIRTGAVDAWHSIAGHIAEGRLSTKISLAMSKTEQATTESLSRGSTCPDDELSLGALLANEPLVSPSRLTVDKDDDDGGGGDNHHGDRLSYFAGPCDSVTSGLEESLKQRDLTDRIASNPSPGSSDESPSKGSASESGAKAPAVIETAPEIDARSASPWRPEDDGVGDSVVVQAAEPELASDVDESPRKRRRCTSTTRPQSSSDLCLSSAEGENGSVDEEALGQPQMVNDRKRRSSSFDRDGKRLKVSPEANRSPSQRPVRRTKFIVEILKRRSSPFPPISNPDEERRSFDLSPGPSLGSNGSHDYATPSAGGEKETIGCPTSPVQYPVEHRRSSVEQLFECGDQVTQDSPDTTVATTEVMRDQEASGAAKECPPEVVHSDLEPRSPVASNVASPASSSGPDQRGVEEDAIKGETPVGSQSQGMPSVASIIGGFTRILADLRRVVLGPTEVRQIDDLLFDAKRATFAAERRG